MKGRGYSKGSEIKNGSRNQPFIGTDSVPEVPNLLRLCENRRLFLPKTNILRLLGRLEQLYMQYLVEYLVVERLQ